MHAAALSDPEAVWASMASGSTGSLGKIMRRILRKIAENDLGNLGDTSTLADPAVVGDLVANRAHA
jgi:hypothetical protein